MSSSKEAKQPKVNQAEYTEETAASPQEESLQTDKHVDLKTTSWLDIATPRNASEKGKKTI